jgi:hypothetical protein
MSTGCRPLTMTAGLVAALPLLVGFHPGGDHDGPACDDPVAGAIHQVEEATHLHALHEVEETYCAIVD